MVKIIISILLAGLIGSMAMPVYANVPPEEVTQEGQGTDPQIPVIVGETATESMPESVPSTRGEELEKEWAAHKAIGMPEEQPKISNSLGLLLYKGPS